MWLRFATTLTITTAYGDVLFTHLPPQPPRRPTKPSPLFLGFVLASGNRLDGYLRSREFPRSPLKSNPISRNASEGAVQGASA